VAEQTGDWRLETSLGGVGAADRRLAVIKSEKFASPFILAAPKWTGLPIGVIYKWALIGPSRTSARAD